jgi:hypothetical protein
LRPVQYFSKEYLFICKNFSTEQIVCFVEDFRVLFGAAANEKKLLEQEKAFLALKKEFRFPTKSLSDLKANR